MAFIGFHIKGQNRLYGHLKPHKIVIFLRIDDKNQGFRYASQASRGASQKYVNINVISSEARNLHKLMTYKISPFGRDDNLIV